MSALSPKTDIDRQPHQRPLSARRRHWHPLHPPSGLLRRDVIGTMPTSRVLPASRRWWSRSLGITDETSPPTISASGSGCCCTAGHVARRVGASLSSAASANYRRFRRSSGEVRHAQGILLRHAQALARPPFRRNNPMAGTDAIYASRDHEDNDVLTELSQRVVHTVSEAKSTT